MPHRVNQWNLTNRGSSTCHNDIYRTSFTTTTPSTVAAPRGVQGGFLATSIETSYPQGAFATCRYSTSKAKEEWKKEALKEESSSGSAATAAASSSASSTSPFTTSSIGTCATWHPEFPAGNAALGTQFERSNTTGTRPVPKPFSSGTSTSSSSSFSATNGFSSSSTTTRTPNNTAAPIESPHNYSSITETHLSTMHQPGEIYRPSTRLFGETERDRMVREKKVQQEEEQKSNAALSASSTSSSISAAAAARPRYNIPKQVRY